MISILPRRESVKQIAKLLCNYVSTKSFFLRMQYFFLSTSLNELEMTAYFSIDDPIRV